jgi:hypothetical protein
MAVAGIGDAGRGLRRGKPDLPANNPAFARYGAAGAN